MKTPTRLFSSQFPQHYLSISTSFESNTLLFPLPLMVMTMTREPPNSTTNLSQHIRMLSPPHLHRHKFKIYGSLPNTQIIIFLALFPLLNTPLIDILKNLHCPFPRIFALKFLFYLSPKVDVHTDIFIPSPASPISSLQQLQLSNGNNAYLIAG